MFGLMVAVALLVSIRVSRLEVGRLHDAGIIGLARCRTERRSGTADRYVPPQEIVGDLAMVALIAGLVGARVFHLLEYPREFLANPWGMIFSRNGFTFYGGLIVGTLVGVAYVRRKGLAIPAFCDALAPAMMLGYAIGRIGCQVSGDGDWGIAANMALKPEWFPGWLWAQTYEHNIVGVVIPPPGVYPTPIYETFMGLLAFAALWGLRKHPFQTGWLFCLYLLLSGIERLAIEQIRVNSVGSIFGVVVTQAEVVSGALAILGACGLAFLRRPKGRTGNVAHCANPFSVECESSGAPRA
jgi:phosphatidylglycerol---prolipoprotein diacylglyceryl transferase